MSIYIFIYNQLYTTVIYKEKLCFNHYG